MTFLGLSSDTIPVVGLLAVAIVGNVACSLLGCYLVLRRLSMLGDALTHGILPGIALGVLLSGSVTGWGIMLGALVFGFLTAFLTQTISAHAGIAEDSSIGIVFTALFSVGVILLTRLLPHVHIDANCIFFGAMEWVMLDLDHWLGVFPPMAGALLITVGFIVFFWKELKISSFDTALAEAMGYRPQLMHYLLMGLVSLVTVTCFLAVGSIVVVAMLIVPAACAYLLTDRLAAMMWISAGVGTASALLGYVLVPPHGNVPGMMAVMAGVLLFLAVLFAPRHGVLAKVIRNARLSLRIAMEDILLPAKRVPTLVRRDGNFFPLKTFLKRLLLGRISSEEIEAELRAQYRRYCELVGKPPAIVILLKLLGERRPLPHIRRVQEPWHMLWQIPGAKAKRTLLNVLGRRLSQAQNSLGFPGADWLLGITNPSCFQDPLFYSRWLTRIPGTSVEVACHPGHRDLTLLGRECKQASDPLIEKRVHDYSLISHADFLDTCQERGFVLASPQEAAQIQSGRNQAA